VYAAHGSPQPGEPRPRILVVDDDADIRPILEGVLGRAGMDVIAAADGRQALRLLFDERPDAVVLDLGLPDLDGFEVLRRMRDLTKAPVLVLTARGLEADKLEGFGLGADNYVTKPFSNAELVARLRAALRRAGPDSGKPHLLTDGPLTIDLWAKVARLSGTQVYLSPIDWNLLVTFVRHKGQVLSLEQLLEHAWSDPYGVGTERVKFATLRLRKRMGWQDPATSPIETVRGFGYRYRGLQGS
jgi:DNA-binding response OmpR family regulator